MKKLMITVLSLMSFFTYANVDYYDLFKGEENEVKCVISIEKLNCSSSQEFFGDSYYSCDFSVKYRTHDSEIKYALGSASAAPMNTDLDSSIASVGVATVNALSSPFRSVKAKMNRNSMIKEIQQEFGKCR
ncbi:hypothetical protein M899_1033 [Bacteriovorax sp. BSW11_IV]|uniref:hypothetical protein n=1 Tax=Bacteriovorax sp. BSW11_IV TaxID=1353529 RepID=UPI00038A2789|nr:hypothetical protein [Bacteriovorax sp. BSW11_IV]EQC48668.1 hypothetical protein M899_1033 [Bacteriovorax sp. BSW11_IV]